MNFWINIVITWLRQKHWLNHVKMQWRYLVSAMVKTSARTLCSRRLMLFLILTPLNYLVGWWLSPFSNNLTTLSNNLELSTKIKKRLIRGLKGKTSEATKKRTFCLQHTLLKHWILSFILETWLLFFKTYYANNRSIAKMFRITQKSTTFFSKAKQLEIQCIINEK